MQVKRLVFRSTNYVYVYHTGDEVPYIRFMGMTEQAYQSTNGSFGICN